MSGAESTDVLIVGGGVAGASAATTLREGGHDGRIVLLTRELDAPYHRPPGSKEHLRGEASRDDALVVPEGWWAEHDVDLRLRTGVLSLDAAERTVKLQTKELLTFDRALLATGAMVRRLSVDGTGLMGVHYLRSLRNAEAIRADLDGLPDDARVVLVGGSYIGCEVAASLASHGHPVTVLMQESEPLQRTFGTEVGAWVRRRLEREGVVVRGDVEVEAFTPQDPEDPKGRVGGVALKDGTVVPGDVVVVGVGAQPDVMLAKRAGLELGETGGVRCDDRLRTSAAGIWAAGDCCEYDSVLHGGRVRIEHEDVAQQQAAFVARQWLGEDEPYATVPYFFSDLADWVSLESVSVGREFDRVQVEGSLEDDAFAVWLLQGDRPTGYASFNGAGDLDRGREVLRTGGPVPS
ncbi:NAD(P)/FAD-dependent oxidoreductase [Patulibacter sp.]|uniref:NAD(P)/FAD-dependent oxidoreductase n=1 Tax=Patulibacter sp. TaxID=1912859 RepID=UPI0027168D1D|nr:FAD-dependent oxidoreductase [Patulibacter sp.]MDO9410254.1 FAD-dependent oxidoreductase [Patulibacter sp.]